MNRFVFRVMLAGLAALAWGAAHAQFADTEQAIEYRQGVMTVIGYHFGMMGEVVKGNRDYDPGAFAADAAVVRSVSGLAWEASLVPGSDRGKTTLKASALEDREGFLGAAAAFESEMNALDAVAGGGDFDAVKAQFGRTAQTCKACHNAYRKQ
jgi:cytochrome c556